MRVGLIGILFAAAVLSGGAQEVRTWTDIKGSRVEAAFVKLDGGAVHLKTRDGRVLPTKLENLCEEDRAYVKELTYKPGRVTNLRLASSRSTSGNGTPRSATWPSKWASCRGATRTDGR